MGKPKLKTNVCRTHWRIVSVSRDGNKPHETIVFAESAETAKLKIPEDEEILSVTRMDGAEGGPVA